MDIAAYLERPRLVLIAGVGICVAALIAIDYPVMGISAFNFGSDRLATRIDEKTAQLVGNTRNNELVSDKAKKVTDAIKRGDYTSARQITAEMLGNSVLQEWRYYPFKDFVSAVPDVADPSFETQLNSWVSQAPGDHVTLLLRAQYYYSLGWSKRGPRFVSETQKADLDSFVSYMKKARADIEAAIKLDASSPYDQHLRLAILMGDSSRGEMEDAFRQGIAKFPSYYTLYEVMLNASTPKWGGSVPAMYAFVDKYVAHTDSNSPLRLLYLSLYRNLLNTASNGCTSLGTNSDAMPACVAAVMQKIVRPDLESQVATALKLYDHSDKYQFGLAIQPILFGMHYIKGGDAYSATILQLAATAMHSDTELKPAKPGQNNYVIDRALSLSWYLKGFYDNSLKKDEDALKDMEATQFPSEAEKDLARADILEGLAGTYNKLNRYEDMIAFQQAAVAVGGITDTEHLECYGYYQLQDYRTAIEVCGRIIKDDPGNMTTRYWRGMAYFKVTRLDDAIADMTVVADSNDDLRASAAIAMSVLYTDRGDVKGSLDVLNKYPYLYNPDTSSRSDVAVSYNNRCYAYMQLGDLKKALSDCRASLKYGTIPDAVRKLQELVQRVGAGESSL
jgi:tetratricopeptide (TPR) repeat protein